MPELRINSAEASNLSNTVTNFSVQSETTDGANESNETFFDIQDWEQNFGYYNMIPELRAVIDAKATWTVGKGYEANGGTSQVLDGFKGWGKDSFNTILENMDRVKEIAGDSFAEVIRDEEGEPINLKPLDPATMRTVVNRQGIIIRYEQMTKNKTPNKKFKPEEIFHLSRNRVADQIHGTSLIKAMEWFILAKNEVQEIFKTVMQRHIKPVMIFHLDTDDLTEISNFKAKMDKAYADGENMYIPKDVVVPEVLAVAPNATLNPMAWLEYLNNQFYLTSGVPQIILGGTGAFTEAAVKIAYLAFQQTIEEEQLYIEEQVGLQLGMEIKLTFPASLENELLSDQKKDGAVNIDPSETTAGEGQ